MDETMTLEGAAAFLEGSPDYRVLRRLTPRQQFCEDDGCTKRIGIILDVETTGLDPSADEIIELGMVKFEFAPDGRIFRVLGHFDRLRQPSRPIPHEITELTGISNEDVSGQAIDPAEVAGFVDGATLIIAHNAGFDRKFCESLVACFADCEWACSLTEVNWQSEGYEGTRLAYLLNGAGLFHDAHRATGDCAAVLEILSRPLPRSGVLAFGRLLETSGRPTVRIRAEKSPYAQKDKLKARGYRWTPEQNGKPGIWWRDVAESEVEAELAYLKSEIYQRDAEIPTQRMTAINRFSARV